MATQITEALRYLSDYLKEENQRLDAEHRELGLRRTIDDAATRFSSLGPQSTVEEARSIYSDMLKTASSQKGGLAAIPTLSQLFGSSVDYIRQGKLEKQDEALREGLSQVSGMDANPNLSGQGMATLLSLQKDQMKYLDYEDEAGYSYLQQFKYDYKDNRLKATGDMIPISRAGFAEKWKWEQRKLAYSGGSNRIPTLTPFMGKVNIGGKSMEVPLSNLGGQFYYDNPETGGLSRYTNTYFDMRVNSGVDARRTINTLKDVQDMFIRNVEGYGGQLADLLLREGIIRSRREIYDDSGKLRSGAYARVGAAMDTGAVQEWLDDPKNKSNPNYQTISSLANSFATEYSDYKITAEGMRQSGGSALNDLYKEKVDEQNKIIDKQRVFLEEMKSSLTKGSPQSSKSQFFRKVVATQLGLPEDSITDEHINLLTPEQLYKIQQKVDKAKK